MIKNRSKKLVYFPQLSCLAKSKPQYCFEYILLQLCMCDWSLSSKHDALRSQFIDRVWGLHLGRFTEVDQLTEPSK